MKWRQWTCIQSQRHLIGRKRLFTNSVQPALPPHKCCTASTACTQMLYMQPALPPHKRCAASTACTQMLYGLHCLHTNLAEVILTKTIFNDGTSVTLLYFAWDNAVKVDPYSKPVYILYIFTCRDTNKTTQSFAYHNLTIEMNSAWLFIYLGLAIDFSINGLCTENRSLSQRPPTQSFQ